LFSCKKIVINDQENITRKAWIISFATKEVRDLKEKPQKFLPRTSAPFDNLQL